MELERDLLARGEMEREVIPRGWEEGEWRRWPWESLKEGEGRREGRMSSTQVMGGTRASVAARFLLRVGEKGVRRRCSVKRVGVCCYIEIGSRLPREMHARRRKVTFTPFPCLSSSSSSLCCISNRREAERRTHQTLRAPSNPTDTI